jgi:hypothetical protein
MIGTALSPQRGRQRRAQFAEARAGRHDLRQQPQRHADGAQHNARPAVAAGIHELRHARPGRIYMRAAAEVVVQQRRHRQHLDGGLEQVVAVEREPEELVAEVEGLEVDTRDTVDLLGRNPLAERLHHVVEAVVAVAVELAERLAVGTDPLGIGTPGVDADGVQFRSHLPAAGLQALDDLGVDQRVVPVRPLRDLARRVGQEEGRALVVEAVDLIHREVPLVERAHKALATRGAQINRQ